MKHLLHKFLHIYRNLTLASFAIVLLFQLPATAQTVTEDRAVFTTPEAPWMVMLDSTNLEATDFEVQRDNQRGYFLLTNKKYSLTVSLFIEPAAKCKTSDECRDFVLKTGNPAWGEVQNVVKSTIGDFSYFEFFRPTVKGQPLQMFDIYAEYVENGYWVDLHISKPLYKKEDRPLFDNLIKSVRFIPKNSKPVTDADRAIESARKVSEDWYSLLGSGKYEESYNTLSAYTKKLVDKKSLYDYWATLKPLGKLKSRKLIGVSLVKSTNELPSGSGARLQYLSSFENDEAVFEEFVLILEKGKTWQMLGYDLRYE